MVKRIFCILLLFSLFMAVPGHGATITKKYTFRVERDKGSLVDAVKFTKNVKGIYNVHIPECIERRGFTVTDQKWVSENNFVVLRIAAQKSVSADTAMLSYSWLPEFIWKVDRATRKVTAVNSLAKSWMDKGTL